jgi:uncharacterized tellurite resistance protein B-like protein
MIDLLRRLLAPAPEPLAKPDAQLALAALLVRVARTDGLYAAEEVERIDRVLMRHHGLDPFAAARLRSEAEEVEASAPDTVRFTQAIKAATALEDRSQLMTALWSVALADGARDAHEDRLMRMVATLLGLSDVDSAVARQRAERQADQE